MMHQGVEDDGGLTFRPSPTIILHQHRLQNISSLCIRNLTISLPVNEIGREATSRKPMMYFTLHGTTADQASQDAMANVIFASEKIPFSANPSWSSFSISEAKHSGSGTPFPVTFVVRLWISEGDKYLPALQWNMALQNILCIGDNLSNEKVVFHSNAVILGLRGLFYADSTSVTTADDLCVVKSWMDTSDARKSYSVTSLQNILGYLKNISQRKTSIEHVRRKISNLSEKNDSSKEVKTLLENIQMKIAHLKRLLARDKALLADEKRIKEKKQTELEEKEKNLTVSREKLKVHLADHRESYSVFISTREGIALVAAQLGQKRKDVLCELLHIFPITCEQRSSGGKTEEMFCICGVKLPDSESFNSKDDPQTSVSLSFTTQLLSMISHFLLVPLRYPIRFKGAQLMILDHVTEKLSDKERLFPLFAKGSKDRFLFEYGVFLLNKNVAQLRYNFGLGTLDLRPTLKNIQSLLAERLGVRSMFSSSPIPIKTQRPNPVPPKITIKSSKTDSGIASSAPLSFASSKSSDSRTKWNKRLSRDTSPHKFSQKIGSRNTELSTLRGELFSTVAQPRDQSPNVPDRVNEIASSSGKSPSRGFKTSMNEDFDHESVDSIAPVMSQRRQLTGLEEIDPSARSSRKDSRSKVNLASARAELLGVKSRRTSSRLSRDELLDRRTNSSPSSSECGSRRLKTDTVSSVDSRERWSSSESVGSRVIDSEKEALPYMSAIGLTHSNGVAGSKESVSSDHSSLPNRDVHVTAPEPEELDLC